ncbi:hybrid sensor histidine kinase/response regulator [Baaleninema sp.]|uniref:hybrid sensor histidine kinase/response regulator n=1 Tax=Baaleninema sp. TaxID=3101197 RepID=UPI003D066600
MDETKVLIVEDELLIAKGLARKLKKLGYTVVDIVSSGDAAIDRTEALQPDIILMDIVIKGDLDGIATTQKIHHRYEVPVIYVTAYADDETLERAEDTGAYGYILKPFKDREVHAAIKCALKKHQRERQVSEELDRQQKNSALQAQFLSMAAHDLRSPLTTILGSTELLAHYGHKFDEAKKSRYLERIQATVAQMNQLLEDILALSRAEESQVVFQSVAIELAAFCRNLTEEFQTQPTPRIQFSSSCDGLQGEMDATLLQHILMNLLSNALKYSPKTEPVLFSLSREKGLAVFEVVDRGIGIPKADLDRLFQAFHRAGNVGDIQGTGLGTAIVKRFVDLHGGTISVETVEGQGSTFIVKLPLQRSR